MAWTSTEQMLLRHTLHYLSAHPDLGIMFPATDELIRASVKPYHSTHFSRPSLGEGISFRTARSLGARLQIHGTIFPNLRRPVKFKHIYFSTE